MRFVYVEKAGRRNPPTMGVHRAADEGAQQVVIDFLKASGAMKNGVTYEQVADLIRQGALDRLVLDIPWPLFEDMLARGIKPSLIQALKRSADSASAVTAATLKKALGYEPILTFDARNPRLQDWISASTGELIKQVSRESKDAVKLSIKRALSEELDSIDTFRSIKRTIGLTTRQSEAVRNFYEGQINSGLDREQAWHEADQFADRQLTYRANVIARTETMAAANQGLNEGWAQAADQGLFDPSKAEVEWVTTPDDRLCPTCKNMDGVRRPFDGEWTVDLISSKGVVYDTIQATNPTQSHPQCRCTSILIP